MAASERWPAFSLSLILHIGAAGFLTWIDVAFQPAASPHYEVVPVPDQTPHDSKIIWYDFRKAAPEVTPNQPFGPSDTPHGLLDPNQTLVTLSPNAPSTHQIIRQPDQPQPLPADVPAPNLVAIAVKLPPKAFVPPAPVRPKAAVISAIDAPTPLDAPATQTGNALGAMVSLRKLPPKAFVPPAARGGGARVASRVDVPVPTSVDVQGNTVSGLQAIIVGLNPGTSLPPAGSRAGQIARAPEAGAPSSGATVAAGVVVPGLLSHGKPGDLPAPVPVPIPPIPARPAPQEIVLPGVNRTMSVPLRPSSRVIPAGVEARFTYRNVYTLVIPGPALPGYGGDWVMWFAERDPPEISSEPRILAPVPARKYSAAAADTVERGTSVSASFQFGASVDKAGHVGSAVILRGSTDPELRRRVLGELESWEFKPALRNGEPMDVDVVLEIPFRFQPAAGTPR